MYIRRVSLLGCLTILVISHITEASTLNCRVCDNARDLGDCTKVALCDGTTEECYMDEIITEQLTIVYRAGCRAKDVCNAAATSGIGRKRELVACSICCSSTNDASGCNAKLCGIPSGYTSTYNQCYACSSQSGAQSWVRDPKDCVSLTTCQADEVCFAKANVLAGGSVNFEYGCQKTAICRILMDRMIDDKKRCDGVHSATPGCGEGESLYCNSCCADSTCNYGECKDINNRIYNLYKQGLFDLNTLKVKQNLPLAGSTQYMTSTSQYMTSTSPSGGK